MTYHIIRRADNSIKTFGEGDGSDWVLAIGETVEIVQGDFATDAPALAAQIVSDPIPADEQARIDAVEAARASLAGVNLATLRGAASPVGAAVADLIEYLELQ